MTIRRRITGLGLIAFLLAACNTAASAPSTGAVRWRWRAPGLASVGMPAADRAGVAAEWGRSHLVLFSPDGTVRWQASRVGVREETPLLAADLVVAPADDGVFAVDRASGRVRWDTAFDEEASSPVAVGALLVTATYDGSLFALDGHDGHVVWHVPLGGSAEGPPASDGRTVVVTWEPERGTAAGLTAVDAATGTVRWTAPLQAGGVSGPAVVGAVVVALDGDLAAKSFDLASGRPSWRVTVGGAGSPEVPPHALPDGRVAVADRVGGLTLIDSHGRRTWSTRVDEAAVRGGPVGPAPDGAFALPLYDGRYLLAGPGRRTRLVRPPGGLVSGVALAPGGGLVVSTAQGDADQLVAYGPP